MAVVVQNQPRSKLTRCGTRLAILSALGPTYCSVIVLSSLFACLCAHWMASRSLAVGHSWDTRNLWSNSLTSEGSGFR